MAKRSAAMYQVCLGAALNMPVPAPLRGLMEAGRLPDGRIPMNDSGTWIVRCTVGSPLAN